MSHHVLLPLVSLKTSLVFLGIDVVCLSNLNEKLSCSEFAPQRTVHFWTDERRGRKNYSSQINWLFERNVQRKETGGGTQINVFNNLKSLLILTIYWERRRGGKEERREKKAKEEKRRSHGCSWNDGCDGILSILTHVSHKQSRVKIHHPSLSCSSLHCTNSKSSHSWFQLQLTSLSPYFISPVI